MIEREHHLLSLDLLASIYIDSAKGIGFTCISLGDRESIEQAVACAEKLGLPVSVERLKKLQPIATDKLS